MTELLAQILADRLRPLPFLERVVGLARAVDEVKEEAFDGVPAARRTRTPVTLSFPPGADECVRDGRYLLPDLNSTSIVFFKDLGTVDYLVTQNMWGKESTLRLLAWFNPSKFTAPLNENAILDAFSKALKVRQRATTGDYEGLTITATLLPAEAALFSEYTYAADTTPLLYPPFRLLGMELKCRYIYRPACLPSEPTLPVPIQAFPYVLPAYFSA
jgi:hypothetical protein